MTTASGKPYVVTRRVVRVAKHCVDSDAIDATKIEGLSEDAEMRLGTGIFEVEDDGG